MSRPPAGAVTARGVFKNYNTVEEFKAADKTALFNSVSEDVSCSLCSSIRKSATDNNNVQIWKSIVEKKDASLLNQFLLITFADLKKYRYYYWFAFPAFVSKPAWEIDVSGWKAASDELGHEAVCMVTTHLADCTDP